MTYPVKTAHYTATKTRKFVTIVAPGQAYGAGEIISVSGKAEARRIAAARGATPWNF